MYVPLGQWFFCKNTEELFIINMNYGATSSRQLQLLLLFSLIVICSMQNGSSHHIKGTYVHIYIYIHIDY